MFKFKLSLGKKIRSLFQKKVDESVIEELEKLFFEADLGSTLAHELSERARGLLRKNSELSADELLGSLQHFLLTKQPAPPPSIEAQPKVIFIIGVNGSGKTTTLAKLAHRYKGQGKKVLVAAADTFRAAAIDQLQIWATRAGVEIVRGHPKADAAAVTFDAIQAASCKQMDILLVDTAGRLHDRSDLMAELEKMKRVAGKAMAGAPHEAYLVLDATIGQNAVTQAHSFHKAIPLTGLILTKLDGTAKGGVVLEIQDKLKLPVVYIGTGEGLSNLESFDPKTFISSLFAYDAS